jgi:fused signal recognition particle receptor
MFDKLKNAFSSAARSIGQKEITERVLDDTLLELQIALLESDVAQEVVDDLSGRLKEELLGVKLEKGQEAGAIIETKLQESIAGIFARAGKLNLVDRIRAKKESKQGPFSIVFLGINGTGKTTTVAKVANLLRKRGLSVVVAAGDTHRAGAIEQLTQHAQRLSLKVIAQRYGADPSAVGRDALDYAKKHYIDVVLIDTAGRMQTSKNLMDEMGKIVRVVRPDVKLFVGDSLAGNDTINQAREFFQYTNFDGAILTKIDADARGGAAISIAHLTARPIVYMGVGQGYDDMIPFDTDKFLQSLFGKSVVSVQDLMPEQPVAPEPVERAEPLVEDKEPGAVAGSPLPSEKIEPDLSPPPAVHASKYLPSAPELVGVEHEQKKGRFGLFGRRHEDGDKGEDRRSVESQRKEEEKRRQEEKRKKIEDERLKHEEEERKRREMEEKKKRKDDKDKKEDEVVYLTDEDIEDLLK